MRVIANAMTGYIARLGPIWVEGQIAQLTRRPQTSTVFLTLRDPVAEVSVQVTCARSVFDAMPTPVTEGARVVVYAKLQYYVPRGSLSLQAKEIRPVGVGELLARIEQRRQLLAAEGLFDPARKRALPFLPGLIGLVVGRDSAAERDVIDNATAALARGRLPRRARDRAGPRRGSPGDRGSPARSTGTPTST